MGIRGDMVVEQAASTELSKFGVTVGQKNYAAAYCTGLLIARRMLKKFGLDQTFKGKEELDGEDYHVEEEDCGSRVRRRSPQGENLRIAREGVHGDDARGRSHEVRGSLCQVHREQH